MQVNAYVDVDVVAVEQDDEVTLMLELVAPATVTDVPRPPAAVQVVLDRASEALRDGDGLAAREAFAGAGAQLDGLLNVCSSPELVEERQLIDRMRSRAEAGEAQWAAKFARMDQSRKSRKRGRGES